MRNTARLCNAAGLFRSGEVDDFAGWIVLGINLGTAWIAVQVFR